MLPWSQRAHPGQLEPPGDHATWLIMAGRGFGKTMAGAEWIAAKVREASEPLRLALVAATVEEARQVMVEGYSGLLVVAPDIIDRFHSSKGELHFKNGSIAKLFSGASPEKLRGFQHHHAWCDELAKWKKGVDTWDNLQFGLRLGEEPKVVVTTTPAASPALEHILHACDTVVSRGTTFDNPHLPKRFLDKMERDYGHTHKGRVELYGEMPPPEGALWTPEMIAASRSDEPWPALDDVAIGVDPPSGGGVCGIVACARDPAGTYHVLADHSVGEASPAIWSGKVADAARSYEDLLSDGRAVRIVAEGNQGGTMVEDVILKQPGSALKVGLVHAHVSKSARAEPIAMLFESGRVRLHGSWPELERQLCGLIAGGGYDGPGRSPDRADAMVWALTSLSLSAGRTRAPPWLRPLR